MEALNKFCKVINSKYLTEPPPKSTISSPNPKIKTEPDDKNPNPKKRSYEDDSETNSPQKI